MVGTVYGAAQSPSFRDPLGITQTLLRSLTDEVVDRCRGPRCIMGDFNCGLLQLEGLNQSFRTELQSTMEAQTNRLEALLEKRARAS